MSKLTVKKAEFSKFLRLFSLKGEAENKELYINFTGKEVKTRAKSSNKCVGTMGVWKGEFPEWGEMGVVNLSVLKKFIDTLSTEDIDMKKTENKLIFTSKKIKYSTTLRKPQYILPIQDFPEKKFTDLKEKCIGNEVTLKTDTVNLIRSYCETFGASKLRLKGEDKKLTLVVDDQNDELVIEFDLEKEVKPFSVLLSKMFLDVLAAISEYNIILSVNPGSPVYIKVADKDIFFEYLIAPLKDA